MTTTTYNSGSGNFTVPSGVTSVQIEVWGGGGGGGGGGAGSGSNGASGGGGGGYCKKNALTVTPGDLIAYVVGAGGVTGATGGDNATAGAQSSVASTYFANGGGAGDYGDNDPSVAASGGTASGGDVNTTGDASLAVSAGNDGSAGGNGASGGAGGAGGLTGSTHTGSVGNAPGGGGGGGAKTDYAGGAGASGRVVFTYTAGGGGGGGGDSPSILRPDATLNFAWHINDYTNVDDVILQPAAGALNFCRLDSSATGAQQWGLTEATAGQTIKSATVWLLAHSSVASSSGYGGYFSSVRLRLNGTWHSFGISDEFLATSATWYSYTLSGLLEAATGATPELEVTMHAQTGLSYVDCAYVEVFYVPSVKVNIIQSFALRRASQY